MVTGIVVVTGTVVEGTVVTVVDVDVDAFSGTVVGLGTVVWVDVVVGALVVVSRTVVVVVSAVVVGA